MNETDDICGSTQDYSESLDEENLRKFIEDSSVKYSYFGEPKSSINRLGEFNLAKSKVYKNEFAYQGSIKEKV